MALIIPDHTERWPGGCVIWRFDEAMSEAVDPDVFSTYCRSIAPTSVGKLSRRLNYLDFSVDPSNNRLNEVRGIVTLPKGDGATMTRFYDKMRIDRADVVARTILAGTSGVKAIDFALSEQTAKKRFDSGRRAAPPFVDGDDEHPGWPSRSTKTVPNTGWEACRRWRPCVSRHRSVPSGVEVQDSSLRRQS